MGTIDFLPSVMVQKNGLGIFSYSYHCCLFCIRRQIRELISRSIDIFFLFQANQPMLYRPVVSQLSWPLVILWFWSGPALPSFCGPKNEAKKKSFPSVLVIHILITRFVFPLILIIFVCIIRQYTNRPIFSLFLSKSSRWKCHVPVEDLRDTGKTTPNTPQ